MEASPGTSLHQILLEGPSPLAATRQAARAVASFHQAPADRPGARPQAAGAEAYRRAGDHLQRLLPSLAEEISSIVDAATSSVLSGPCGPAHGDLKPDHLLLEGDVTHLVDLDSYSLTDPVADVALLLARLHAMPRFMPTSGRVGHDAAKVFAEEYFTHVGREWRRRLPPLYAGATLDVVAASFRRHEPQWRENAAEMVVRAITALSSGSVA